MVEEIIHPTQKYVLLECVNEGSKLRVKMKSPGYLINSNCQFPRALRVPGRKFKVPVEYVKLITQRGRYFYSIKNSLEIKILNDDELEEFKKENIKQNIKIYEDADVIECSVCLCNIKDTIFIPCGHFYTCSICSPQLKTCPICRVIVTERINKSQFD